MIEVSVVLPIYNAGTFIAGNLQRLHGFLRRHYESFEIIAVNDGSNDATDKEISALELSELRIIHFPENKGKGAAVKVGMLEARGSCRLFTDADLPFDLRAVCVCTHLINERAFHMVVGDRTLLDSGYYDTINPSRLAASRVFSTLTRLLITGEIFDTQCGLKAFRGDVTEELFSLLTFQGFAFDVEVLYIALKYNLEIRRIPVRFSGSTVSSVNPITDGFEMFASILRLPINWSSKMYQSEQLERLGSPIYWD